MEVKELIKAAKIIQPHLENYAGEGGGARIFLSEHQFLHALIWTHRADNISIRGRHDAIHSRLDGLCRHYGVDLFDHVQKISQFIVLTPDEYEEQYFFTKPPFCEEG